MRIATSILFFAALALPLGVAQAQMVYKCVGKGGAVSFQSAPCPPTHRTAKAVFAPPEPERPRPVPAYAPSSNSQAPVVSNHVYGTSAAETERDRRKHQCALAKQSRQATLDRVGLQRTHDLLRKLDNAVYDACQGL